MPALETDLKQISERGRHAEKRSEHEYGQRKPHHVHAPCDDLCEAELFGHCAAGMADVGEALADEHRGEDDVDQESRYRLPSLVPFDRHVPAGGCEDDQPKRPAHDGRRQVEFPEKRERGTDCLAADEKKAQTAKRGDSCHVRKISL